MHYTDQFAKKWSIFDTIRSVENVLKSFFKNLLKRPLTVQ